MTAYSVKCPTHGITCYLARCVEAGDCQYNNTMIGKAAAKCIKKGKTMLPSQSPTAPSALCHAGLYPIGKIGSAQIWLGRETAVAPHIDGRPKPVALIVNCAMEWGHGIPKEMVQDVAGNEAARMLLGDRLFKSHKPTPQISVDWPDYGTPNLRRSWWVRLSAALSNIDGDVIFHCVGGHGRTGTAAAILACLNGWVTREQCPVTWLRERYCQNVVESEEQIFYIEEITGWKVHAQPAKWSGYTYSAPTTTTVTLSSPRVKHPTMSLRKYAKWLRTKAAKARPNLPTVKELRERTNRTVVVVGTDWFMFDPATKTFIFLPETTARHTSKS